MGMMIESEIEYLENFDSYSPYQEAVNKVIAYIEQFQADYENRLNSDMVAMLRELHHAMAYCEISGIWKANYREGFNDGVAKCCDLIQQKINALKENTDVNK